MRKILFLVFISFSMVSNAQMNEKIRKKEKLFASDSVVKKIQLLKDSVIKARAKTDNERIEADNVRNINNLLELQKKRKVKEKRNAIFRIAIGLGFLVILIIGWRRKTKK